MSDDRGHAVKLMVEGHWRGDVTPSATLTPLRAIHAGAFRGIVRHGDDTFPPTPRRYHLFVSYACPFAHRTLVARALKRLQDIVDVSVLHPRWNTSDGWVFGDGPLSTPDRSGERFTHLHQAYARSRVDYTGKVTVPVLWDTRRHTIVSNESRDIVSMFNTAFDECGADAEVDLAPAALRVALNELDGRISEDLAGGVYEVAAASTQGAYDRAVDRVFRLIGDLEDRLRDGRLFLHGDAPTTSDVLAFPTLARFDAVYNPLFRVSRRRLVDHPRLARWVRRIHELPGIAETVRFDHILAHYHDGDWAVMNRRDIVPELPRSDFRAVTVD